MEVLSDLIKVMIDGKAITREDALKSIELLNEYLNNSEEKEQ